MDLSPFSTGCKEPPMNSFPRCFRSRPPALLAVLLTTSLAVLWLAEHAPAQQVPAKAAAEKRPLTHDDYDIWRSIQSPIISGNGQYVAYTLAAPDNDSELV